MHLPHELLGLVQCVLPHGCVQHQQCFVGCVRLVLAHYASDFGQFGHQVVLGMQSSSGVGDKHINFARFGSGTSIEDDRGRICPRPLGNDRNAKALTPTLKLFNRRRAEGVARRQHHTTALAAQTVSNLGDSGGLAGAIHAHHQNDERAIRPRAVFKSLLARLQDGRHLILHHLRWRLVSRNAPDFLDDTRGRAHADIGRQQERFKGF